MGAQQLWARIIGIVLVLVGIAGFFMGDSLAGFSGFSGFGINLPHNIVHLVTGAIFLWAGFMRDAPVKMTNQTLGVIYVIIGIIGFFGVLAFLNVNNADNFLHLAIGIISVALGWMAE